jgi:Uma2 family endonuclease
MIGALVNATVDGAWSVLPPSMKVYTPMGGTDVIANPAAIVEVLSDATELFDRGEKFRRYRAVPSVIDGLLVAQHRVRVEHYKRGRDDTWVLREHGPGARL